MKLADSSIYNVPVAEISVNTRLNKRAPDLQIFNCHKSIYQDTPVCHPIRSDYYIVYMVLSGSTHLQLNLVDYPLTKNSLVVISPNMVHQSQKFVTDCMVVGASFSRDYLSRAGLLTKHIDAFEFFSLQGNPYLLLDDKEVQTLHSLLLLLRDFDLAEEENAYTSEIIRHGFNMLLYELAALFKKYRGNQHVKITRKEEYSVSFIKLLTQHFREERSVQYYADALFVTPKHLSKTVKEITGKTCGELIDEMVIAEAKILLSNSVASVGQVADELHFSDQFFFSKFFKSHTGLTPSEYKIHF
jgi:AraC-like DNA-binding protein